MMGIEDCSWSAIDVLNIVDSAELVTIVRDIYLCVWYGGGTVEIYDLTDSTAKSVSCIRLRDADTFSDMFDRLLIV